MRIRRSLLTSSLVVAVALVAAGCSGGSASSTGTKSSAATSSSSSSTKVGGSLTVYTSEVQQYSDALDAAFQKESGTTVTTAPRVVAGDLIQRVTAEEAAGGVQADVLDISDQSIWSAHPDWFYDLSTLGLSNYASYPSDYKWGNKCVDVDLQTGGLAYNTSLVDKAHAPKTWTDLLKPYWKGHIVLTDPRASGTYMSWAIRMQTVLGNDYLTKLAAQDPVLVSSATTGGQQVAAGAQWVSVEGFPPNYSDLIAQGAPLKFVVGTGPTTGHAACIGIFKSAKNLPQAKAFVNWLMTPAAQSVGCQGAPLSSPLGNIPNCQPLPKGWKASPLDPQTGAFVGVGDPAVESKVTSALGLK